MPKEIQEDVNNQKRTVMVCHHTACLKAGAISVFKAFQESNLPENIIMELAECQGQCSVGPIVRILPDETWYCRVKPEDVPLIVEQDFQEGKRVEEKLHPRIHLRLSF